MGVESLGDLVEAVMIGPFSAFHTKACLAVAAARPTVGAVKLFLSAVLLHVFIVFGHT